MKIKIKELIQPPVFLLFISLVCIVANGQIKEKSIKKIYFQAADGISTRNGSSAELGIQVVLKSNWITSVSYKQIEIKPQNLPADYKQGFTTILIFPFNDAMPVNNINFINFTLGKYFEISKTTWITAEAGLSIVTGDKFYFNSQRVVSTGYLIGGYTSSNYSVNNEKKTTIGGILKADFNWSILPYWGIGAGVFANFNSIQSPVGFHIKLISGWLNMKKNYKKNKHFNYN